MERSNRTYKKYLRHSTNIQSHRYISQKIAYLLNQLPKFHRCLSHRLSVCEISLLRAYVILLRADQSVHFTFKSDFKSNEAKPKPRFALVDNIGLTIALSTRSRNVGLGILFSSSTISLSATFLDAVSGY